MCTFGTHLNNRFKEIKDLKSDVVFSIDEDIKFPYTMVGFVHCIHGVDKSGCAHLSISVPQLFFLISMSTRNCEDTAMYILIANAIDALREGDSIFGGIHVNYLRLVPSESIACEVTLKGGHPVLSGLQLSAGECPPYPLNSRLSIYPF
ncbi:hypothetical protein ACJIZ3_009599 [Penstemon smallii]|uniref:Uncharacterized protein n=1 Tax=Penstemon smallii TaxID=265156 RepID=A0ABD3TE82_9LAMI